MNLARAIALVWYTAIGAVAVVAFLVPLLTPPTPENPTADAGLHAPILALCAGALAIAQALRPGGLRFAQAPAIGAGIASLASAYLWIADAAGTHPREPAYPGLLWLLLIVTVLASVGIFFTRRSDRADLAVS